ncbi:unnamed protein product [Malus baccata var. baccata]
MRNKYIMCVVARDEEGRFVAACRYKVIAYSVAMAEAIAILQECKLESLLSSGFGNDGQLGSIPNFSKEQRIRGRLFMTVDGLGF